MQFQVPLDLGDDPQALFELGTRLVDAKDSTGLGRVDVLINNGGVGSRSAVADTTLATDVRVMNVNFLSAVALTKVRSRDQINAVAQHDCLKESAYAFLATDPQTRTQRFDSNMNNANSTTNIHVQAVLPSMIARGSGKVVIVSSVQGKFGLPFRSSYAASKHALHGWFDSLRAEVADAGITVTCVCPGYVATNFSIGAVRGDSTAYNRMDETTASGMNPDALARLILSATAKGTSEIIPADFKARAAVVLRVLFPEMLAGMLAKRARKGEGRAD